VRIYGAASSRDESGLNIELTSLAWNH
jgi:hypothetical protein